jgi:hypothetical protein
VPTVRPSWLPGLMVRVEWWALAMAATMERPSPRPSSPAGRMAASRWNGCSSRVTWPGGMTGPVLVTVSHGRPPVAVTWMLIWPPGMTVLVAREPTRERLAGQLMLALYRSGRQADALAAYRAARSSLVEELGLEPGAELKRLEAAVLAHDPALDLPPGVILRSATRIPGPPAAQDPAGDRP